MKKIILLIALCAFIHAASAAEVDIRKDTEVCNFNKAGKNHCYYKKPSLPHHQQKQNRKKNQPKKNQPKKTHPKHKPKHRVCKWVS